jgi:hypothetical protein
MDINNKIAYILGTEIGEKIEDQSLWEEAKDRLGIKDEGLNPDEYFKDNPYIKADISQIDNAQLIKGLEEEYSEHYDESIPDIKKIIGKIVVDHLTKDPNYYNDEK